MAAHASSTIYGAGGTGIGGLKEDFDSLISWGSRGAPFFDLLKEGPKATNNMVEIDTESIEAPASKRRAFGADFAFGVQNETSKIHNYTALFDETWELSKESANALVAGRNSEMKRRMTVAVKQLLRGVEKDLIQSDARAAGSSGVAAQPGGLEYWITTNTYTPASLTESDVTGALEDIVGYTDDASKQYILLGKTDIIGACQQFTTATDSNVRFALKNGELSRKLTTLTTAFGEVILVPCGNVDTNDAFILDMETWELRFMGSNGFEHVWKDKPDKNGQSSGHAYRGNYSTILTLMSKDERRNARITVTP